MVTQVGMFSIMASLLAIAAFSLMFGISVGIIVGFWTGVVSLSAGIVGEKQEEA